MLPLLSLIGTTFLSQVVPGLESQPKPSDAIVAIKLAFGPNTDVDYGLGVGLGGGAGLEIQSLQSHYFLGLDGDYTAKLGEEIEITRFSLVAGPAFSVGENGVFRIGAGAGLAMVKNGSNTFPGTKSMSGTGFLASLEYVLSSSESDLGFSLNYYQSSEMVKSVTYSYTDSYGYPVTGSWRETTQIHEFSLKLEWRIPLSGSPTRSLSIERSQVFKE